MQRKSNLGNAGAMAMGVTQPLSPTSSGKNQVNFIKFLNDLE